MEKGQQQRQQRLELLDRLAAEKKQLEQRKLEMQVIISSNKKIKGNQSDRRIKSL